MRIAFLNPSGKMGGAETSLREILASIRAAQPGWDLWLVLGEDGPLAQIARAGGVHVEVGPFPPNLRRLGDAGREGGAFGLLGASTGTARYTLQLSRLLREVAPDVIHTNGFKMHLLGALACPRKTPLVWHIHDYVSSRRLMSRLLLIARRRCTMAVVNSKSVGRDLATVLPKLPAVAVYNAIDLERFSPAGEKLDLDALAGLAPALPQTIRVGLVSTFARWKGHKVFLEALSRLPAEVPIRGYIIGGSIYQTAGSQWSMAELRQEADRLGVADRVGFTGFVEDPAPAMRALDIVVHASTNPEPFGMVIIEAMACGKAVVASQAGGALELFENEENALGHPPGDADALSKLIVRLAADADLRHRLGDAGRAAAVRCFSNTRLATELIAVYGQATQQVRFSAGERRPSDPRAGLTAADRTLPR